MGFILLFFTLVLGTAALLIAMAAFQTLLNPFADDSDLMIGIILLTVIAPLLLAGSISVSLEYSDYCPPLVPTAAPELAE